MTTIREYLTGEDASLSSSKKFSLSNAYQTGLWAYVCINAIAEAASSIPVIYKYRGKPVRQKERSPVYQLFNPPADVSIPSFQELLYRSIVLNNVDGICHWTFKKSGGVPASVYLKRKNDLRPVQVNGIIEGYAEADSSGKVKKYYALGDIITFSNFDPSSDLNSISAVKIAAADLAHAFNMSKWNSGYFEKGFKKDIILSTDRPLTSDQRKEMTNQILEGKRGAEGAHGLMLLSNGLKPFSPTGGVGGQVKDFDFLEASEVIRENICAVFNVPPAVVGIYRYANYANSEQQIKLFWTQNIVPLILGMYKLIQLQCVAPNFAGHEITPDLTSIRRNYIDFKELAETAKIYIDLGYSLEQVASILDAPELIPDSSFSKPSSDSSNDDSALDDESDPKKDNQTAGYATTQLETGKKYMVDNQLQSARKKYELKIHNLVKIHLIGFLESTKSRFFNNLHIEQNSKNFVDTCLESLSPYIQLWLKDTIGYFTGTDTVLDHRSLSLILSKNTDVAIDDIKIPPFKDVIIESLHHKIHCILTRRFEDIFKSFYLYREYDEVINKIESAVLDRSIASEVASSIINSASYLGLCLDSLCNGSYKIKNTDTGEEFKILDSNFVKRYSGCGCNIGFDWVSDGHYNHVSTGYRDYIKNDVRYAFSRANLTFIFDDFRFLVELKNLVKSNGSLIKSASIGKDSIKLTYDELSILQRLSDKYKSASLTIHPYNSKIYIPSFSKLKLIERIMLESETPFTLFDGDDFTSGDDASIKYNKNIGASLQVLLDGLQYFVFNHSYPRYNSLNEGIDTGGDITALSGDELQTVINLSVASFSKHYASWFFKSGTYHLLDGITLDHTLCSPYDEKLKVGDYVECNNIKSYKESDVDSKCKVLFLVSDDKQDRDLFFDSILFMRSVCGSGVFKADENEYVIHSGMWKVVKTHQTEQCYYILCRRYIK